MENKCQAISSDVVSAATNLLLHDNIPVRRDAARVISATAVMIGGRSLMPIGNTQMPKKTLAGVSAIAGPTLPRLAKLLLGCNDELVKMYVAEAMCGVTTFRDGCQQVVDQGTVKTIGQYLVATLPDLPQSRDLAFCLLYLLRTLAAVVTYASNGMRDILGVGLIAKIILFLGKIPESTPIPVVTPEDSAEIVRQTLRLLWQIGNDPAGRKEMLKADGVKAISRYLSYSDGKARESAVCALNVIALETDGRKHVLGDSMEGLARLLHSEQETVYLHETCVQICRLSAELPAFRFAFARHVLKSIWLLEKIFGTTSLAAVSPLLDPSEDRETRVQAAHVMAHFLHARPAARGDEIRVPPVSPLKHIDNPAMFAIEECVDILHNLIGLLPIARDPALACLDALTNEAKPRDELRAMLDDGRAVVDEAQMADLQVFLQKT